jgi:hypothetical protein
MARRAVGQASQVVGFILPLIAASTCGAARPAAAARLHLVQETVPLESRLAPAAHVRGADATARMLLQEGAARSATFRRLLDVLQSSDLIVYVETGVLDRAGRLVFVAAGRDCRFLRISVRTPGRDADLIAWLGHELQHAVEIAAAQEVTDQHAVLELYQRIGIADRTTVESAAAQETWARVRDEVLFGPRASRR